MVKTLTIKDDVYNKLVAVKKPGESFSELFNELLKYSYAENILYGLRGSIEFTSKEKMLDEIYKKEEKKDFDTYRYRCFNRNY